MNVREAKIHTMYIYKRLYWNFIIWPIKPMFIFFAHTKVHVRLDTHSC